MNKKTKQALKKSIDHWTKLSQGKVDAGCVGSKWCALCELFLQGDNWCQGCPIYKKTGKPLCRGTPYSSADHNGISYGLDSPQFKRAARKELAFLKTLLPTENKTK